MDEDFEKVNIEELTKRLLKFCKLDKNGRIFITDKELIQKLTIKDKILITLSARYLANKLDSNIQPAVSSEEIARFFSDKKEVIYARAKELKDDGKISIKERGTYLIYPFQIDDFITYLETRWIKWKIVNSKNFILKMN